MLEILSSTLPLIYSYILQHTYLQVSLIFIILYIIYYKNFSFYRFIQKSPFTIGKHRIGKTLPPYPNGWFAILASNKLSVGETKYIDAHGESLCVYRGNNGKAYVISAFCPHLGANLGIEGRVVRDSCIQCPFHGWTFDGENGNCVIGKDKKQKESIEYEYQYDEKEKTYQFLEKCAKNGNKENKENKVKVKTKKFISCERSGYIHAWFSEKEGENQEDFVPPYEPFDISLFSNGLTHRGYSLNKINCHASDIAENGGDILHFLYIHNHIIPKVIQGFWDPIWIRGDDPELKSKMKLDNESQNKHRMELIDRYINEKNKKYVGVIHLVNKMSVLGINKPFYVFSLTGFQVGPGLVYLFMKGMGTRTIFFQHVETKEKFKQELYHDIYTNNWSPYWLSALTLRLEARQVLLDGVIWDNKKFAYNGYFNRSSSEADDFLIRWRQWFSQYYDGCKQEKNTLEW